MVWNWVKIKDLEKLEFLDIRFDLCFFAEWPFQNRDRVQGVRTFNFAYGNSLALGISQGPYSLLKHALPFEKKNSKILIHFDCHHLHKMPKKKVCKYSAFLRDASVLFRVRSSPLHCKLNIDRLIHSPLGNWCFFSRSLKNYAYHATVR